MDGGARRAALRRPHAKMSCHYRGASLKTKRISPTQPPRSPSNVSWRISRNKFHFVFHIDFVRDISHRRSISNHSCIYLLTAVFANRFVSLKNVLAFFIFTTLIIILKLFPRQRDHFWKNLKTRRAHTMITLYLPHFSCRGFASPARRFEELQIIKKKKEFSGRRPFFHYAVW